MTESALLPVDEAELFECEMFYDFNLLQLLRSYCSNCDDLWRNSSKAKQLLPHQKIEREVANLIASTVWAKSQDIRDRIKIKHIQVKNECRRAEREPKDIHNAAMYLML